MFRIGVGADVFMKRAGPKKGVDASFRWHDGMWDKRGQRRGMPLGRGMAGCGKMDCFDRRRVNARMRIHAAPVSQ